jgi:hypothetical protein
VKITIESTDQIVDINNGLKARVWEGETDSGIKVTCFVTRIAVHKDQDSAQFEKELKECRPPRNAEAYSMRMFLD